MQNCIPGYFENWLIYKDLNIKRTLGKVLFPQCRKLAPCTHAIVLVHVRHCLGHATRLNPCSTIPSYALVAAVAAFVVICTTEKYFIESFDKLF